MGSIKHINIRILMAGLGSLAVLATAILYAQTISASGPSDTVQVSTTYPLSATKPIPVTVGRGVSFSVTLPSNPTTGYSWVMAGKLSDRILKKTGSKYIAPAQTNPPMAGQGGVEVWTFTAVSPGTQVITLNYARPWEKNKPPAKTQQFKVRVE